MKELRAIGWGSLGPAGERGMVRGRVRDDPAPLLKAFLGIRSASHPSPMQVIQVPCPGGRGSGIPSPSLKDNGQGLSDHPEM